MLNAVISYLQLCNFKFSFSAVKNPMLMQCVPETILSTQHSPKDRCDGINRN